MLLFLLGLLSCNDNLLSKHTIEEKYIYPSYYDVWVETDTAIIEVEVYVPDVTMFKYSDTTTCVHSFNFSSCLLDNTSAPPYSNFT